MDFEAVIGLEIHIKLQTASKMFCACRNDIFELGPNESVCPICMGFPGTLPVVNKKAIEYALRLALALHTQIAERTKFDRKNYFYPDLPKGYQISQYDEPLATNGFVEFLVDGEVKTVRITRLHVEEDAGKLVHEKGNTYVDFNRAGTPLVEIVTQPDFRTPQEVTSFLRELQQIARYLNVSRADMEKGEMRCDVNISLRPKGQQDYGVKVEVKNMNSFSAIERALVYEIKRQLQVIEQGEKIIRETRGWNDDQGLTESQRNKEEAHDYRYFPEPDLPPLKLDKDFVQSIAEQLPELPTAKRLRYQTTWQIKEDDARVLATDKKLADFFEAVVEQTNDPLKSANVILHSILHHLHEEGKTIADLRFSASDVAELIQQVNKGALSMSALKMVLEELYQQGGNVVEIIKQKGLQQVSDRGAIENLCREVLRENGSLVQEYKGGKTKVFGALVGQVMKKSGGKVNPSVVNDVLLKLLEQ
jgi:aspartyl-tRNA(Asn)/glutamyl-tRNA(Gln) amidotransferase subunit B